MTRPPDQHAISRPPDTSKVSTVIPRGFRPIPKLQALSAVHHLGYPRNDRFFVAAYHPEAGAIIWKDGRESGFGLGGWEYYFRILLPAAMALEADLTDEGHIGQDVLVVDRQEENIYIAPRPCADEFIALHTGLEPPQRRCICARPLEDAQSCEGCPARRPRPQPEEVKI